MDAANHGFSRQDCAACSGLRVTPIRGLAWFVAATEVSWFLSLQLDVLGAVGLAGQSLENFGHPITA